jgi:hypothetical protein
MTQTPNHLDLPITYIDNAGGGRNYKGVVHAEYVADKIYHAY